MGRTGLLLLVAALAVSLSLLSLPPAARYGLILGPDGPIAGASVRYQGTSITTRSNRAGRSSYRISPMAAASRPRAKAS